MDLFTQSDSRLIVYYMNTRQKKIFKVSSKTIKLLSLINGQRTFGEIKHRAIKQLNVSATTTTKFIHSLYQNRILTIKIMEQDILSKNEVNRYSRQINYFSEFFSEETEGYWAQRKLIDATVTIFGCGSVGGNIAIQLARSGIKHFILMDAKKVSKSDIARHMYFEQSDIGLAKVEALKKYLMKINSVIKVETFKKVLRPETDILGLIGKSTFVVNTADEPYIGYTSAKISRVCVKLHTPMYSAGGFDAHLASTGEMIIPGITPCADCYADYFHDALKDWKPQKYPERHLKNNEMGGLASMALFASSFASVEIIKYIARLVSPEKYFKTRGELLFEDFNLTYLNVKRNPECKICAGVTYESKN